jgi:hypothetical protein
VRRHASCPGIFSSIHGRVVAQPRVYLNTGIRPRLPKATVLASPTSNIATMWHRTFAAIATLAATVKACGEGDHSCYGPLKDDVVLTRNVRRMQPDAQNATTMPKAPLEWGQINFLHTTDTHGWLEGHIKEQNYGADWGDYVSFTKHMKQKAKKLGVDLLLIDTGVSSYGVSVLSYMNRSAKICRTCTTELV